MAEETSSVGGGYMHKPGCDKMCGNTCSDNKPWDYVIVEGQTATSLRERVIQKTAEGYRVSGGVCAWDGALCQAMYRDPIIYYRG